MSFFSNWFGPKKKKDQPDFAFYENVIHTIAVSETLKDKLLRKVRQAFDHPESFYDQEGQYQLSARSLNPSKDDALLPKFVLIDLLQDHNEMAEVDWKETEQEVRYWINALLTAKTYLGSLSNEEKYGRHVHTGEVLDLINQNELKPLGYALEILDIDSDSYVFTIVPLHRQEEVQEMFRVLK